MAGEKFGVYLLETLIGRGGMGEVYRAFDTDKKRVVALKRLPPQRVTDAGLQARFRRESQVAARLREPHIIPIHDFGEIDGSLFIDMRLVEGASLATLLAEQGPLPPDRAVNIVTQVASALDAAHADGLVHRDVKPSNVLLANGKHEDDYVYLTDFGIAHVTTATRLTETDRAVGTVCYMAPERFLHGNGDHRVDIYSLACLLYETLTGYQPFPGEGSHAQEHAHANLTPPRPSDQRPGIPAKLDDVVARGMAKDPDQRYCSAGEMANAARATLTESKSYANVGSAAIKKMGKALRILRGRSFAVAPGDPTLWPENNPPQRRHHRPVVLASGVIMIGLAVVGIVIVFFGKNPALWAETLPPPVSIPSTEPSSPRVPVISTIPVGNAPDDVAVSPDGSRAYTADAGDGTVSVIDTSINEVISTIAVNGQPDDIAVSLDGEYAYATNKHSDMVSVINTRTEKVVAEIPVGADPDNVAVSADGQHVYITKKDGTVSIIDTSTNAHLKFIEVGKDPDSVAVFPDGSRAFVTNSGDDTVSVIDTKTNTVTETFEVRKEPESVAVSPDGRRAYITNPVVDPVSVKDTVSVIDTNNNTIIADIIVGNYCKDIAITRDGRHVYISNEGGSTVSVIETDTNTVIHQIDVNHKPKEIAISPDGRRLYVINPAHDSVSVLDISAI